MSDCEETNVFWESWTWTPGKRKRKKDTKKDKKCQKRKNDITVKTDENIQKKKRKKNSKFKEAMEGRKEKKKKKKRLDLEVDDSFIFTRGSGACAKPTVTPDTLIPHSSDKLNPDKDCKKKTKRKKKVAFDLSPGYICAKHPKCGSSSQQSFKESVLLENEAVRHSESCVQVTVTRQSQGQTHANESQCNSEEINSQDLFITQKTFRALSSEASSGEASDKAVSTSPQVFTPREKLHTSSLWIKQHFDGSYECPQDSRFHQQHRKTNEHVQKPNTAQVLLIEEEEEEELLHKAHPKKVKELNANLTKEKKVSRPAHKVVNAYLDGPVVVNQSLDVAKSKEHSRTSSQQSPSYRSDEPSKFPSVSLTSASTQTENFFTTELSSYLSFCQKSRVTLQFDDLKPLDLSLPKRARKDSWMFLSVKTPSLPGELKGDNHKEPDLHPSCSSDMKDAEAKKEPSSRQRGKSETTSSPQSESEPKSADTTTSSEDDPPCRTGKLDLTQVRAVQTRLNESFFFKTKGEGQSPRAESPLMKLAQSRELKSRKAH